MAPASARRPTKAERTRAARETERLAREERERRARRNALLARWGVVLAVLVIVAVVAVVVVNSVRGTVPDAGPAPRGGNEQGGITLVSPTDLEQARADDVDLAVLPDDPVAEGTIPDGVAARDDGPVQVVAYVDVNCVFCADFETRHAGQIRSWLDAGDITFEYRTVAYLDRNSSTDYSSRGANAAACVADTTPEAFLAFNQRLYERHGEGDLDDAGLLALADDAGAGDIDSCVENGTFRPWVKYTTEAAKAAAVSGTPTVYVDGEPVPNAVSDFDTVVQEHLDGRD